MTLRGLVDLEGWLTFRGRLTMGGWLTFGGLLTLGVDLGGLVDLDEVGDDVMFVEIFAAVSTVTRFDFIITAKPFNNRLSHVNSPASRKTRSSAVVVIADRTANDVRYNQNKPLSRIAAQSNSAS